MAFALTKFESYGIDMAGPSKKRGKQEAKLTITALAADVDLDIGDDAGTFWTAAQADAVYGALATKVLEILNKIADNAEALLDVKSPQLLDRVQVAALSGAGQYTLAIQDARPNVAVNAADGELAWIIVLEWSLNDGIFPIISSYG